MQALDLEGDEWTQFAEGIAKLATTNEKVPDSFKAFKVAEIILRQIASCEQAVITIVRYLFLPAHFSPIKCIWPESYIFAAGVRQGTSLRIQHSIWGITKLQGSWSGNSWKLSCKIAIAKTNL